MIYLKAIVLAIVEGITEFLPISSTGHLILVEHYLNLSPDQDFNNAFMILIQFPAIFSVVLYFWADIWPFSGDDEAKRRKVSLWRKTILAVIPALVFGALLGDVIDKMFFAPVPVIGALIVGGVVLILMERLLKRGETHSLDGVTTRQAVGVGLFQCLALFPGTSRSGASIFGGMALGLNRETSAAFSFILAIPTMAAATAYSLLKVGFQFTGEQWAVLALGSVVSFVTAYIAVWLLMGYIQKHSFAVFGWYRIVLGATIIAALAAGIIS